MVDIDGFKIEVWRGGYSNTFRKIVYLVISIRLLRQG